MNRKTRKTIIRVLAAAELALAILNLAVTIRAVSRVGTATRRA